MRWEALFADLEAELAAAESMEIAAEVADRSRWEVGRLTLVDRLLATVGGSISISVPGSTLVGRLRAAGPDWLLLDESAHRSALVPLRAVRSLSGLSAYAVAPGSEGLLHSRLDFRYALRSLARGRAEVVVVLVDGARLPGRIDRVAADFVEMSEHPADEPRRPVAGGAGRIIPLDALGTVLSG